MRPWRRLIIISMLAVVPAFACRDVPGKAGPSENAGSSPPARASEGVHSAIIGVMVTDTERELPGLFDEWKALGINTVFAPEALVSSGGFRALAQRAGLDTFIIFPIFFAPDELAADPDLWSITADGERAQEDWVEFTCPNRADFRDRRIEEARSIVKRLRPEGLSIDFIRYFVYWEMVAPDRDPATLPRTCYCVSCLQAFATYLGVPIYSIPPQPQRAAAWIQANAADQWVRFKADTITSMAREIADGVHDVDPEVLVDLNLVPWRRDDYDGAIVNIVGQDPSALGEIADLLSPMTYSFMLHRSPEWVASVVEDLGWVADCPIVPSIQVGTAYREGEELSRTEFEATLRAALEPPSAGVVFWSWDHIETEPEKAEVIRRVVSETTSEQ